MIRTAGSFGSDGAATLQARTRHREVTDEGDCGDRPGCGYGRDEAGGAARAAGGVARQPLRRELRRCRCSGSCVGIHRFFGCQKWFEYEAQTLIPYISNGPLISWMYPVFGIRGANAVA